MLPAEIAQAVKRIQFVTGRQVSDVMAGAYLSVFKGRGMEFDEVRPYVPGDDVRTIDWNVTARSGVPHVKEFVEERDLTVLVVIDVSGSMAFGSVDWRKCDIAAELAAVFAFSAVQNSDRIGLLLFSNSVGGYIPPRRGQMHAQVIVRAAVDAAMRGPEGVADLDAAARYLEQVSTRRAVVIVISDFLDQNFERTMRRLDRRHDVVAITVSDPREERFPEGGLAQVVDVESGVARFIDLRHADVARRAAARDQLSERRFRAAGVDHLNVSTAIPYDRELLRFFRERAVRRR